MNMTPNERAEQEAKEIVENAGLYNPRDRAVMFHAVTSALLPKYELMELLMEAMPILEGCQCLGSQGSKKRHALVKRISSTLQKIGGGR